jgi:hypothetical protein
MLRKMAAKKTACRPFWYEIMADALRCGGRVRMDDEDSRIAAMSCASVMVDPVYTPSVPLWSLRR